MSAYKRPLVWDADKILNWLREAFHQVFLNGAEFHIEKLEPGHVRVRCVLDDSSLRPGGTIMGPAMMKAADIGCYVLLLAHDGEKAGDSVTTNMSMSFLRRPEPGDITCDVSTLKHGRTLVVMGTKIYSSKSGTLIANGEMSYFNAAG